MKDKLAEKLLAEVTGLNDVSAQASLREDLQVLSRTKYDDYGGYTPGVKFMESLAMWLNGFDQGDRAVALDFIRRRLAYVSGPEMDHLVSTVYRDLLRPEFVRRAAKALGLPPWQVAKIVRSPVFASIQRRTLILGMSDGARLDTLRRASMLSTEQFHLDYVIAAEKAQSMRSKLEKALSGKGLPGPSTFDTVLVVDDFSGSGASMLRWDDGDKAWDGKIVKIRAQVQNLIKLKVVSPDATVTVLLYLITPAALKTLSDRLERAGLSNEIRLLYAHQFSEQLHLTPEKDSAFWDLCRKYFRGTWQDEHNTVGGDPTFGFGQSALPLVLHHNSPNNAPPIIWKDDLGNEATSQNPWYGVFPRHERHHPDRP